VEVVVGEREVVEFEKEGMGERLRVA